MIAVLGAGSVGGFVGAMLAGSGVEVCLIGRPGRPAPFADGVMAVPMDGAAVEILAGGFATADALPRAEIVIVAVKSGDTVDAAARIAEEAPGDALVVSLQNGVTNGDALREVLGDRVADGIFGFNLVRPAADRIVQTTEGEIVLAPSAARLMTALRGAGLTARVHENMTGVLWSKLLLNLNNALNVLSGRPLRDQIADRGWRRVLAACMDEGLAVALAEGVRLEKVGKLPPRLTPAVLRLPDWLFLRIAGSLIKIDPEAKSSMADDYAVGRPPEIDWLNGHIVARGAALGVPAPVNAAVTEAVKAAFADAARPALAEPPARFLRA